MIIAQLIGALIGAAIGSLIGAMLLRAAAQWIIKEDVAFGKAYGAMFITYLINAFIGFLAGVVISSSKDPDSLILPSLAVILPVGILVQSGIITAAIPTKFKSACVISLAMFGIILGVIALVFGYLKISGSL
jgi:predicted neutral ceramidase superfamily lipid hydrolase